MGDAVEVVRADVLSAVRHGFLGRRGGVSVGAVAGLNCGLGAGDDAAGFLRGVTLSCVFKLDLNESLSLSSPSLFKEIFRGTLGALDCISGDSRAACRRGVVCFAVLCCDVNQTKPCAT